MSDKDFKENSMIVTTSEISVILGLSDRRIRQLENEGCLVKISHGKFDLPASIQKYIEFIKEQEKSEDEVNLNYERTLLTRANRQKVELELQIMRGELHRSEDVRRVMNDMLGAFRARCLSIPSKAAPRLIAQTELAIIQDAIKKEIYEALSELSEYDPEVFYARSKDVLALGSVTDEEDEVEEQPKKGPKRNGQKKKT